MAANNEIVLDFSELQGMESFPSSSRKEKKNKSDSISQLDSNAKVQNQFPRRPGAGATPANEKLYSKNPTSNSKKTHSTDNIALNFVKKVSKQNSINSTNQVINDQINFTSLCADPVNSQYEDVRETSHKPKFKPSSPKKMTSMTNEMNSLEISCDKMLIPKEHNRETKPSQIAVDHNPIRSNKQQSFLDSITGVVCADNFVTKKSVSSGSKYKFYQDHAPHSSRDFGSNQTASSGSKYKYFENAEVHANQYMGRDGKGSGRSSHFDFNSRSVLPGNRNLQTDLNQNIWDANRSQFMGMKQHREGQGSGGSSQFDFNSRGVISGNRNLWTDAKQNIDNSNNFVNGLEQDRKDSSGGKYFAEIDHSMSAGRVTKDLGVNSYILKDKPKAAIFEEYWSAEKVKQGLADKTLIKGTIRINKKSFHDSYVTPNIDETHIDSETMDDIYIPGKFKRNRALEGDVVVVKLLDGDELVQEIKRDESRKIERRAKDSEYKRLVVMSELNGMPIVDDVEDEEEEKTERTYGKVVYIMEIARLSRIVIGTFHVEIPSLGHPLPSSPVSPLNKIVWFRPNDKRVPFVVLFRRYVPAEFLRCPSAFENFLWKVELLKWDISSQYPSGKILGKVGIAGDLGVETESLLLENGITWSEFSEPPWTISQSEIKARADFRNIRIFTIDPSSARDLDDALSIVERDDGSFDVGVHIADVSYFVDEGSDLDMEAKNRATTVYLVQKCIPMLPRLLCEELCSLNPGVDRFAFSIVWNMSADGVVLKDPWFGKSIIRSCAKLSYEDAQAVIEDNNITELSFQLHGDFNLKDIKSDILKLHYFSVKMRGRRFENGALSMNSKKLWFQLDEDGSPLRTGAYEIKDSNRMIEEFMLLANISVGNRLCEAYPTSALLRRHEPPKLKPLTQFVELAASLGYKIDATSSASLQASFMALEDKPHVVDTLRQLCIKSMARAKYFCNGTIDSTRWSHYALNIPLYTHFTSPIRRYCDVIVHRMLFDVLNSKASNYDTVSVSRISKNCNLRKFSSKDAQDASQLLYVASYISKRALEMREKAEGSSLMKSLGGVVCNALVFKVGERSFDVLVKDFALEKRVWLEKSVESRDLKGCQFDKVSKTLVLYWRLGNSDNSNTLEENFSSIETETLKDSDAVAVQKRMEKFNTDPKTTLIQNVRIFDIVPVLVSADMAKSPPVLQIHPMYPETRIEEEKVFEAEKVCVAADDEAF